MNRGINGLPPVVKNLIILNTIMLILMYLVQAAWGTDLNGLFGIYFPKSEYFKPFQVVTHMFMHGGPMHLLLNMFALYMFGGILEQVWGPKRFLLYYFVTGLGAAFTHLLVQGIQYNNVMAALTPEQIQQVYDYGTNALSSGQRFINPLQDKLSLLLNIPTVGASGAIFGVLLAFGILFPNTPLYIFFIPIPVKAKYVIIGYAAIELYSAVTSPGSNIAHAAHLGGMIFGYIMIRIWRKTTKTLY